MLGRRVSGWTDGPLRSYGERACGFSVVTAQPGSSWVVLHGMGENMGSKQVLSTVLACEFLVDV